MAEITVKQVRVLRGPNVWAYRPVLEVLLDIGKYEQLPSNKLPGFTERLVAAIPTLWDHRCSEGHPGGFLERLRIGTYMGHIIEHVVIELQGLAGMPVIYGKTRSARRQGQYHLVVAYKDAQAARMCVDLAIDLAEKLANGEPLGYSLAERIEEIREVGQDNLLGPSSMAIVDAARRRHVPWYRLDGEGGSLVQLGHGRFARRVQAAETSLTNSIAVDASSDKELTKTLLSKIGLPVPGGEVVDSADAAWKAARELDGPVVVKPRDGNQGRAVSINLTAEEQVRHAFDLAREHSRRVIVERFVSGSDHRLLVVDGEMVAASRRIPAQVVADGLHSVARLVEMVNADPDRGSGHGAALTRIRLDAAADLTLAKQQLTRDSVPPAGQVVLLRDNSNLSTGGTAIDVTDEVHPDNAYAARLAARAIGLDVAGVDIVCEDIGRPLSEQGGAIVEVNAAPGLRMHVYPSEGRPRPVGEAIVDMLFPRGSQARVPLIAITGTNGKTTVTRMIGHVFSTLRKYVGMTTTDGIYFDGVRRIKGDCSGPASAEAVLQHPLVEVAVLETARGGILRSGLGWDRSTVSVVTNVAADHLGLGGVETVEDMARVKRVIVESVSADGYAVLNAEDRLVSEMAARCPGKVIFFAWDPSTPVLTRHLAAGGRGAYLRHGSLVFGEGTRETTLLPAADIPATHGGLIPFQVQNALAAAAACWGAGVDLDTIRLGLRTFQADHVTAPGRFNLFNVGRAHVIVDYGHNPHAMRAMQRAIEHLNPRRALGVIAAPGDRRDADIQELATIAADTFDWVIVREDRDLRERAPGEVAHMMAETICACDPSLPVTIISDEDEAIDQALEMLRPGDLLVLFADDVDAALERVRAAAAVFGPEDQEGAAQPAVDMASFDDYERIRAMAGLAAQGIYPHFDAVEEGVEPGPQRGRRRQSRAAPRRKRVAPQPAPEVIDADIQPQSDVAPPE